MSGKIQVSGTGVSASSQKPADVDGPVFHATLSRDSSESRTGGVIIKDFDFEIIKTAIELCYGRESTNASTSTIVGVLRIFSKNLGPNRLPNFCPIATYAWECSREDLMKMCTKYLNDHRNEVTSSRDYPDIKTNIIHATLALAYALNN
uniref:BTB domain-containing protein n=1 Tax=Panagrellus redivivus TaxID=6233 RepID=A0A7E4VE48_PANRE